MSFSSKREAFFRFFHVESIFKDKIKDFKEILEIEIDTAKELCLEFESDEEKIYTSLVNFSKSIEKDLMQKLNNHFDKLKEKFEIQEEYIPF